MDFISLILMIIAVIITLASQFYVTSKYNFYKNKKLKKDITGVEIARKILDSNGLKDIYVTETKGVLSDHYDPNRKVVRLSKEIFHGNTIASASVSAHEVGHAVQDKENYFFIKLRGFIFPLVSFASKFGYVAILIGFLANITDLIWVGIGMEIIILLFQLITLPVEFDASKRAIIFLEKEGFLEKEELEDSESMLKAAALTYVASLATTLLEILRLVLILTGRDD